MDLSKLLQLLRDELRGAWRFRRVILIAAWATCLLGWIVVLNIPDRYEASARVYVDSRSILRPLLQGLAINPDVTSGLDLVRQLLLSRQQLEQVARDTGLADRVQGSTQMDALVQSMKQRVKIEAADARARSTQGEGTYTITFEDFDRQKAVHVVSAMLNSFVENSLGEKRTGQTTALRFLDEQIAIYEKRLGDAENRLAEFKKRNVGVMPDSRGDYFARYQQAMIEVEAVQRTLSVAERRREELDRQLSGEEPFLFGIETATQPQNESAASNDIGYRLQALQKQLDELLLRYTDKHPEVISTRQTIDELKSRQDQELARVRGGQSPTGSLSSSLKNNPVFQSLQIELKRTQVQVAELRQELASRQAQAGTLRRQLNTVPEVEAQLSQLNRDYEITRQSYQEFLRRRETASVSENADETGAVKFQTIDPPVAPAQPMSPNRPLLMALVLLAGLGVAAAVGYTLNHMRPVFFSSGALAEITGLKVIASVGRAWSDNYRATSRRDLLRFSVGTGALITVFAMLLLVGQPLARQFHRLFG